MFCSCRFIPTQKRKETYKEWAQNVRTFQLNLCLQAAVTDRHHLVQKIVNMFNTADRKSDFLLDLYSYLKDFESQTCTQPLPAFHQLHLSYPDVWSVDLSKRKAFLFLQVLQLQKQRKKVVLRGWSNEESEMRIFLLCVVYISGLE